MSELLYRLCEQGTHKKLRKLLLAKTKNIDRPIKQENGRAPLHIAAEKGVKSSA